VQQYETFETLIKNWQSAGGVTPGIIRVGRTELHEYRLWLGDRGPARDYYGWTVEPVVNLERHLSARGKGITDANIVWPEYDD
jgi:hypothetical protein